MIGTTLSHYSIESELGRGGMGIVYKARDTKLDREVAIKVLPASALSNEDDRARFYREAKAAASLTHPNIAAVYQIDEAVPEGAPSEELRPFIAMEFIDGETLDARIKNGPLKIKDAVQIAMQVASALGAAHKKDVVHRDIKSANIMLTSEGEAKVLDFGLAQTSASTKLTRMGSTLGTVAYMSPEQARGEAVDQRTDLWSLGAVLYEMVAGQNPFGGDYEQAVVYSIMNEAPEPLTARRTGVPMELERIVNKALSKEVDVRYQSAAGFVADLKGLELAESRSIHHSKLQPSTSSAEASHSLAHERRFSPTVVAGIAVLTLLLGLLAGGMFFSRNGDDDALLPVRRLTTTFDGLFGFTRPVISPDERYMVFSAFDTQSEWAVYVYDFESGEIASRYPQPMEMYPDISPDGRWVLLSAIGHEIQSFQLPDGKSTVVSTEGEWAYWESNESIIKRDNNNLVRMPASGGALTIIATPDSSLGHVRLWPSYVFEGGRKAFVSAGGAGELDRSILLLDLETGESKVIVEQAHQAKYLDSGHIMYSQGGGLVGQLVVQPYDVDNHEVYGLPVRLDTEEMDWTGWNVSEGGTVVFSSFTPSGTNIRWMDLNGNLSEEEELPMDAYSTISFAPEGDYLLVGKMKTNSLYSSYEVTSLGSGRPPIQLTAEGEAGTATWTADGSSIYLGDTGQSGTRSTIRKESILRGGGSEVIAQLPGKRLGRLTVAPDESFLIFADDISNRLFRLSLGDGLVVPWGSSDVERADSPVISPSGDFVAYTRGSSIYDMMLVVSDIEGNQVWSYRDSAVGIRLPQWSPDGRHLYFKTLNDKLVRVAVQSSGQFEVEGNVEVVGELSTASLFSIHPDGDRILTLTPSEQEAESEVQFIFNFGQEAERIAPTR